VDTRFSAYLRTTLPGRKNTGAFTEMRIEVEGGYRD
jgi:hypothetical protein